MVFARGFVIDGHNIANNDPIEVDHWVQAGNLMQAFNRALMDDPRINVTLLRIFKVSPRSAGSWMKGIEDTFLPILISGTATLCNVSLRLPLLF